MNDDLQALSAREKETLRLLLRGHDAKSIARHLGLSVHTVNERLRDARRKLGVSSSREAARILGDSEQRGPDSLGTRKLGWLLGLPACAGTGSRIVGKAPSSRSPGSVEECLSCR